MSARGLLLLVTLGACGYRPVYGGEANERLHVVQVRAPVADAVAADEVTSGLREELAREGALASGDGYPRVEVEITRLDETSDAVAAAGLPGARVPLARATEVGVVARAWLVRTTGSAHERDTGDVRVLVALGATRADGESAPSADRSTPGEATPTANASALDSLRHADALRAAGRRAGMRLARRILGEPAPEGDLADEWQGRSR